MDIAVGDKVQLLDLPNWLIHDLPETEQAELRAFVGRIGLVEKIDSHGYYWLGFGNTQVVDGYGSYTGHSFCVSKDCLSLVNTEKILSL
jgi:hypothetical protein